MTRRTKLHLPEYLPYLINRVGAALVARFSAAALERHDLSIAMWRTLVALSASGPQRQIDLADLTSVDISTLSRLITRLVQAGLVTRARSDNSSREVTIALTPKAEKLIDQLIPIARDLEKTALGGLSAAALRTTKAAMRRMYENLDVRSAARKKGARLADQLQTRRTR